jgi:hypothetical protein
VAAAGREPTAKMIARFAYTLIVIASIGVSIATLFAPNADLTGEILFGAATVSFGLVGLLLVVRAPGNRIGPVLVVAGALLALANGCDVYGAAGAAADPMWPGSAVAALVGDALFVVPIVLALIGVPLIFPDGHLISRRWRFIVWLTAVALAANTIGTLVGSSTATSGLANPLAVPELEPIGAFLGGFASATSVIGFGAAAAALWVRYRRGGPTERQQLKWLVAVAALAALFFPIAFIVPVQEIGNAAFILGTLTLIGLPLAIGLAILRYRLYDIDRIVSRSIAYGLITAILLAAYGAAILVLQGPLSALTGSDTILVALSTLIVAALFQPLRRRVQRVVDRRFDRARYDADRTAVDFAERLRDQTDLTAVTTALDRTTRTALAPRTTAIWIRGDER